MIAPPRSIWIVLLATALGAGVDHARAQLPPAGDPPFIPTSERLVEEMLSLAEVQPVDTVYDLGSGDGRAVIAAARLGARGVGIEYDAALVALSRTAAAREGIAERVEFHHQDIFESDFSSATVVFLYLGADFNLRLRPRLLAELRPGSRVVSHAFHMAEWEPDSTLTLGTGAARATLYAWVIPAVVDGFWSLEIEGMDPLNLELLQSYQRITGSARGEGLDWSILEGQVRGELVHLEIPTTQDADAAILRFEGSLVDGRISGTIEGPPPWGGRNWQAVRLSDPSRAPLPKGPE